ncbi:hypothetical protein F5B20DRAFT_434895 [Whalleya microplaca]|nr:hypothetical protein F5B20DRAFT_434895 [Whalleya microplaca]
MKGSRSVCLLCRYRTATAGFARLAQWQIQPAPFSTTAALGNNLDDASASSVFNGTPAAESNAKEPESDPITMAKIRRFVDDDRERMKNRPGPPGPPKHVLAQREPLPDSLIPSMFQKQKEPGADPSWDVTKDLDLIKAIGKLERMIESNEPATDAYAYLQTVIYPMARQPGIHIPRVFYKIVSRLLKTVVAAKKAAVSSRKLPPVTDILRAHVDIGEMEPQLWATLVGELVQAIVGISPEQKDYKTVEAYQERRAMRDDMLNDLIDAWKILSVPKVVPEPTPESEIIDGFWFPRLDKFALSKFSNKGNFVAAFNSVFPQYPQTQLRTHVPVLAIATLAVLLDPQRTNSDVRRSAARFISRVSHLITFVRYRDQDLRADITSTFPSLEDYIVHEWNNIKAQLQHIIESKDPTKVYPRSSIPKKINTSALGYRLKQAYVSRNPVELDKVWQEFIGPNTPIPEERAVQLRECADLFDSFIGTWMQLNQPDQAIMAWNTSRTVGLRPTIKTWNEMLDGCKAARNLNGLKSVWTKLVNSKIELDVKAWTTRISGLFSLGDPNGGLAALEEMCALYEEASRTGGQAVQPSIAPINAVIAGLVNNKQLQKATSLMAWARKHGIEPDTISYNMLLRGLIRTGRYDDARGVFGAMKSHNVSADEATFTIILEGAFAESPAVDGGDDAHHTETVEAVFRDMEQAGLKPNLRTYGKMIHNLLGDRRWAVQRANTEAVKSVLAHLWGRGLELSPHIYTMLVEHFLFERSPPDVGAVEALLERRRLLDLDGGDIDHIFHDRLVKAFALVGHVDRALELFRRLSAAGAQVHLDSQLGLLRALLKLERIEDAGEVARTTMEGYLRVHPDAVVDWNAKGSFWDHAFWRVAVRHELV